MSAFCEAGAATRRCLPLVLTGALAIAQLGACAKRDEPEGVRLGTVTRSDVTEVIEAPGTVTARATATLRAPAEGLLKRLHVTDGDRVRRGEILAEIDSPQARERLRQAREADAELAAGTLPMGPEPSASQRRSDHIARQGFQTARRAAAQIPDPGRRARMLAEIAQTEAQYAAAAESARAAVERLHAGLENVTSAMQAVAAAQRVQARAALRAAERTVAELTLRAPFDGVVSLGGPAAPAGDLGELAGRLPQRLGGGDGLQELGGGASAEAASVAEGAPVTAGGAVVTVTDVSRLTVSADVDEADALKVEPGVPAEVEVDAVPGAAYPAEVTGVGAGPARSAGGGVTYRVTLVLRRGRLTDGAEAPWPKPGMSAVVNLRVREVADTVAVPSSAVLTSGRDNAVWVVSGGRAQRRIIRIGAQGETMTEVTAGLRVGERIVVRGAGAVEQGQELPGR